MSDSEKKKRILVVEDEKITAMDIRERLKGLGYDAPLDVSTGEEAIQLSEELRPDLVLMDIVLRGKLDGVETADIIRERYRIPVVFLTAFSDDRTLQRAKVTEPFGYILKPFEERELHTTIEMALYKHSMDRQLRQSQENFSRIFMVNPDCVTIMRVSDTAFVETNKAFTALTGYSREETLGQPDSKVNLWVNDGDRDRWFEELQKHSEVTNFETQFASKKGMRFTALLSSAFIQFNKEHCILNIWRDISDRKQAENALRESESTLRTFINALSEPMFLVDANRRLLLANNALSTRLGSQSEALIGTRVFDLLPPGIREQRIEHLDAVLSRGEPVVFEDARAGRSYVNYLHPVLDQTGKVSKVAVFALDITQRLMAEKALRVSEESFAKVFQMHPDALNINRVSDGSYVDINGGFITLTGYSREEALGKNGFELNLWEDHSARERGLAQLRENGELLNYEARFRMKDGCIIDGLISSVPIEFGGEKCLVSITRDITELKRANEAIKESQQQLAGIVGSAMDGIITIDRSMNIVLYNGAAESMFQCPREQAIGRPLSRFIPDRQRSSVFGHLLEFAKSDVTGGRVGPNSTLVGVRSNGEEFPIEMSISQFAIDEEPLFTAIIRDVTEQKKGEAALQASEKRYREFFERDLTGNFVARPDGFIVDCNPAFLHIFKFESVEDSARTNMMRLFPSPEQWTQVVAILENRDLENHETELTAADGKPLYVIENLFGEYDEQGNLSQIRGFIFDNTERKILEQQLFHAQRMESIGTLASGIAHDFNNVLNNILGFAHQMKKHVADQAKVTRYADTIEKSASRGADLANQLMLFVRKKKRENAIANVEDIIDEVIHLTTETFPKFITVRKNVSATHKHVSGDRGELYQALLNLCLNARDAMLEKGKDAGNGTITLGATSRRVESDPASPFLEDQENRLGHCIELFVTDDGVGIPGSIKDKIFDPFFTTKERGKGTGLGLSVVYNIVRNHNGVVTVESEEGKGTTFRITLPAVETESKETEAGGYESLRSSGNELILLVDDEVMMQDLGRELLEDAGYRVVIAQNGNQAVEVYRKRAKEISLVILDLVMPGMDGGQTYVQLKQIDPGIKAFFCTGYAQDSVISSLLESEDLRALEKPFKPPLFLKAVREALGQGVV